MCGCFDFDIDALRLLGPAAGRRAGRDAAPAATEGGTLSVGVYNFDTYNPIATQSQSMTQVSAFIYDGLMRKNSDYTMSPCLAQSYTVSDNGLTYTFSLRQDVTWHDGSGFDANDVDYTIRMIQELENSPYKDRLANGGERPACGQVHVHYHPEGS